MTAVRERKPNLFEPFDAAGEEFELLLREADDAEETGEDACADSFLERLPALARAARGR